MSESMLRAHPAQLAQHERPPGAMKRLESQYNQIQLIETMTRSARQTAIARRENGSISVPEQIRQEGGQHAAIQKTYFSATFPETQPPT
jgi:chitodextrinase